MSIRGFLNRPVNQRTRMWQRLQRELLRDVIPDSRFDRDIFRFVPDFHESSVAIDRVLGLDCYGSASAILVAPDNSLEYLRYRALKDGKKLLVATRRLCRGFVLLDPRRISQDRYELASCLDGLEKPGIGRHITLAQMQEEGISIDMFVIGSWAVNRQGSQQWNDSGITRLQWLILADRGFLNKMTPVITVVHSCQVIEEEDEEDNPNLPDDMQCDYVITPEEVIRTDGHEKFDPSGPWFDKLHDLLIHMTPPLQELKGIKMMEKIMGESGLPKGIKIAASKIPDSEEQMGMEIATRIIQGYKV